MSVPLDHIRNFSIVATVRRDVVRAGMLAETRALIEELSGQSADFRTMWAEQDVFADGEGTKRIRHPVAGVLALEFSTFALSNRPDLALVVFNPLTEADRDKVRALIAGTPAITPRDENPSSS